LLELQDQLLESSHYILDAAVAGSLIELTGDMAALNSHDARPARWSRIAG
jgi:hypothetical protein